jgi:hypothetical protein
VKDIKAEKNKANEKRLIYAAVAIIILVSTIFFLQSFSGGQGTSRAAIIDQLGSSKLADAIRDENQTFLEAATELLYKRFSVVDFYSDNATIEQYKQLASAGYKLIVWRAHSAMDLNSKYIAISATDKYGSINYDQYLENGQLTVCNITGDLYFGITPKFIEQAMTGTFQDTVIVLMSCNGLKQDYLSTAQAFEAKGAKVLISWDEWISPSDNDYGTGLLLQHLINENDTVSKAVGQISPFLSEFGWAHMRYYPQSLGAANYRIPDYRGPDGSQDNAAMTLTFFTKIKKPPLLVQHAPIHADVRATCQILRAPDLRRGELEQSCSGQHYELVRLRLTSLTRDQSVLEAA